MKTGFEGRGLSLSAWRFAADVPADPGRRADSGGPTFLDALKDQLGLKLTSATGENGTLIIGHIEQPSAN